MIKFLLTYAHNDTVTESLQMCCPVVWSIEDVIKHLNGFGVLDPSMFFLTQSLSQVLMDQLS